MSTDAIEFGCVTASIIIPTCNRCEALSRTLASLAHMDGRPEDFEVLVVDNGSTDRTRDAFHGVRASAPKHNWRYCNEPMPGLLSGRHRGTLETNGEICIFIDDDVRVGKEWLVTLFEVFRDVTVALAGGPSTPLFTTNPPAWLDSFYLENEHGRSCGWLSLFDGGDKVKEIDSRLVFGLNFSIRRNVLFELGGFHPDCIPKPLQRFQGDGETGLSLRIARAGLKALYHPRISVHHEIASSRLTWEYFEERAFYQGVCDSYTQIRAARGVPDSDPFWKSLLRRIIGVRGEVTPCAQTQTELQIRTAKAYEDGYSFHQCEVRNDPALLEWVMRKDYWDYRLPTGWRKYMSSTVPEADCRALLNPVVDQMPT